MPMPLNLSVFGIDKADEVIDRYEDVDRWIIGGHSLGGAMAARYVNNYKSKVSGLILLASYPAESDDLSNSNVDVLSIYATQDGITTVDNIINSRKLLPGNTTWKEVKGGNHSQFGYYGFQSGDNKANISREEQQKQIINDVLSFIANIDK